MVPVQCGSGVEGGAGAGGRGRGELHVSSGQSGGLLAQRAYKLAR